MEYSPLFFVYSTPIQMSHYHVIRLLLMLSINSKKDHRQNHDFGYFNE